MTAMSTRRDLLNMGAPWSARGLAVDGGVGPGDGDVVDEVGGVGDVAEGAVRDGDRADGVEGGPAGGGGHAVELQHLGRAVDGQLVEGDLVVAGHVRALLAH